MSRLIVVVMELREWWFSPRGNSYFWQTHSLFLPEKCAYLIFICVWQRQRRRTMTVTAESQPTETQSMFGFFNYSVTLLFPLSAQFICFIFIFIYANKKQKEMKIDVISQNTNANSEKTNTHFLRFLRLRTFLFGKWISLKMLRKWNFQIKSK